MADAAYGGGAPAAAESSAPANDSRDSLYSFDEAKLQAVRETRAWMQDPKYFKKVKISPSAAMKMVRDFGKAGIRNRFALMVIFFFTAHHCTPPASSVLAVTHRSGRYSAGC